MSAPESNEEGAVRTRWTDSPAEGTREGRAGALLRKAVVSEPLNDVQLAAVRARLLMRDRPARRPWALRFAMVLAVLLGFSGLVIAATEVKRWIETRRQAEHVQPIQKDETRATARHHRRAPSAVDVLEETSQVAETTPIPEAPPPVRVVPAARKAQPSATEPRPQMAPVSRTLALNSPGAIASSPPAASPLADESELLARALLVLRQRSDARGALALFDEHAARFPAGALAMEERVGRVEALLQLGRRDEALAILDQMALPSTGKRRDMLVTRGELRARTGRCAEALIDFGVALTSEAHEDVAAERALYGRASCRARLGDADGARADLEAYATRFPTGRFAADVRAALNR